MSASQPGGRGGDHAPGTDRVSRRCCRDGGRPLPRRRRLDDRRRAGRRAGRGARPGGGGLPRCYRRSRVRRLRLRLPDRGADRCGPGSRGPHPLRLPSLDRADAAAGRRSRRLPATDRRIERPGRVRVGKSLELQPASRAKDQHAAVRRHPFCEQHRRHAVQIEEARHLPRRAFSVRVHRRPGKRGRLHLRSLMWLWSEMSTERGISRAASKLHPARSPSASPAACRRKSSASFH